jgi:hypothetical protein
MTGVPAPRPRRYADAGPLAPASQDGDRPVYHFPHDPASGEAAH